MPACIAVRLGSRSSIGARLAEVASCVCGAVIGQFRGRGICVGARQGRCAREPRERRRTTHLFEDRHPFLRRRWRRELLWRRVWARRDPIRFESRRHPRSTTHKTVIVSSNGDEFEHDEASDALDPRVAAARAEHITSLTLSSGTSLLNPHHAAIPVRLYNASRESARRAFARFTEDYEADRLEAALLAGSAAEYLLRAVIAAHDPLLLADRHVPSQIALSRANTGSALDLRGTRTIGTSQVLEVLRAIHPGLAVDADLRFVMDHRNAAAHLALVDAAQLNALMVRLVQVVEKLHTLIDRQEAHYWGVDLDSVVAAMKSERASELQQVIEVKYARARALLDELTSGLSEPGRELILEARESRPVRWAVLDAEDEPTECPVCGRTGWTSYAEDRDDAEFDSDVEPDGAYQTAIYSTAVMFQCPVCGLVLEANEIGRVPWAPERPVRYEAVADPFDGWEPDKDLVRGR